MSVSGICDKCGAKVPEGVKDWYGSWHDESCPMFTPDKKVKFKESGDTYELPPEVAGAIASERLEFIHLYAQRIRESDPEKAELARLVGDLLMDRRKARQAIDTANDAIDTLDGSIRKAQRMGRAAALVIMGSAVPEELET